MVESGILYENEKVAQLKEIFFDIDETVIYEVLVQCGDSVENATEVLICMKGEEGFTSQTVKESFVGLSDRDLEKIHRDLEEEQHKKLIASKKEDQELQKALDASMKQLKIDQKKQEKEVKKMEKQEKVSKKKQEEEKKNEGKPKKLSFGQKLKNLFKKKKNSTINSVDDVEIPEIKHPATTIQD